MRDITDLSRETLDNDPHLSSVVVKRLGAVASLPWELRPAEGKDVDEGKARDYQAVVREQLENMKDFRKTIYYTAWGLWDGRAAQEIDWQATSMNTDAGLVRLLAKGTNWIHPRRINFDDDRSMYVVDDSTSVSGNFQTGVGFSLDEEELERSGTRRKFILWTPAQFGDYQEREGIALRAMYWSFFKRFAQRDFMETLELFGKPWRVGTIAEDADVSQEDVDSAQSILDGLGYSFTALMPRGIELEVVKPGERAGEMHLKVQEAVDKQISKLVLGQTGTTDNMAGGLNTSQSDVMRDEQTAILSRDAQMISAVIENDLTDAIIEVNFTAAELPHAPTFHLRADLPPDRKQELERLKLAEEGGLQIPLAEAYAASGFRMPDEGEAFIQIGQPPTPPLAPVPPAPRPVVVYPPDKSPPVGEQQPAPPIASTDEGAVAEGAGAVGSADVKNIVTVNEARADQGLPPLTLPDGSLDPDGDLTIAAYEKKLGKGTQVTQPEDGATNADTEEGEEITTGFGDTEDDEIAARTAAGRRFAYADTEAVALGMLAANTRGLATRVKLERQNQHICLQTAEGFSSELGSTDELVDRGQRELWAASRKWAKEYQKAVEGMDEPRAIYNALIRASEGQDLNVYARPLERRMRQGAALGILDNAIEIGQLDGDGEIVPEWATLERYDDDHLIALAVPRFTKMPFTQAMIWFRARGVMPRAQWENLSSDVKRRTFTVAGVQNQQMLEVLQDELAKQIGLGASLREFTSFMDERLKSAGMIPSPRPDTGALSASHVDTVFRTNTANAYGAGRHRHATQPAVLRARPIWQWRFVNDRHTRQTHAQNFMLWANDPFWQTVYSPAGWRCRCRCVSRPASYESQVVSGETIRGLPDPGFVSGVRNLL
jgi:hypothetical protein